MALYLFICPIYHEQDERRSIDRRDDPTWCAQCGRPMRRVITSPYLRLSNPGFTRRPEQTEKALLKAWETGQA